MGPAGYGRHKQDAYDPAVEADMVYPERFSDLPEATWPRLRGLLDARTPGGDVINMTIGEPEP